MFPLYFVLNKLSKPLIISNGSPLYFVLDTRYAQIGGLKVTDRLEAVHGSRTPLGVDVLPKPWGFPSVSLRRDQFGPPPSPVSSHG